MPGHPGAFRGICKSFLVVALCRSFPLLVTAMVGTATLKRSHRLRTQPIMNRPRTLRRGESNTTRSYVLDMRRTSLTSSLTTCDLVSQHVNNLAHHNGLAGEQVSPNHDRRYCRYRQPHASGVLTEAELRHRFRQGVLVGLSATASHTDRPGESKARGLLECLRDRPEDVLRFLTRPDVPPTSNDAERALRPSQN